MDILHPTICLPYTCLSDVLGPRSEETYGRWLQAVRQGVRSEIQEVRAEMQEVRAEMQGLEAEMRGVRAEMQGLEAVLQGVRTSVGGSSTVWGYSVCWDLFYCFSVSTQ